MTSNKTELLRSFRLSEKDEQLLLAKIWGLLRYQTKRYNGIDSTSVSSDRLQELLASAIYTISLFSELNGWSQEALLDHDLAEILKQGQQILVEKKKAGFSNWEAFCLEASEINNIYYVSTIKELGAFFDRYDIYFAAHEIPCSIDYPLLCPVSSDIKGLSYIEEYLTRLKLENRIIGSFDIHEVLELLRIVNRYYENEYLNLCEPVLVCSVGTLLLGRDPDTLKLSNEDVEEIYRRLVNRPAVVIHSILSECLHTLLRITKLSEEFFPYFDMEIESLSTRIATSEDLEAFECIFYVS